MKYYKSKTGEVMAESEWLSELEKFWGRISTDRDIIKKFKRPDDSWERFKKILGLEEVAIS